MKRFTYLSILAFLLATTGGALHSAGTSVDTITHRKPTIQMFWRGLTAGLLELEIKDEPMKAVRKRIADFLSIAPEKITLVTQGKDMGNDDSTLSDIFLDRNQILYVVIAGGIDITAEQLYEIFGNDATANMLHREAAENQRKSAADSKAYYEKQIAVLQDEIASLKTQLGASIEKNALLEKELTATKAQLSSGSIKP